MAATAEAARLTEAHRLAQARLGRQSVRQALSVWPLLDPQELDATFPRWLRAILAVIRANRPTSARLAANYLSAFRTLELGVDAEPFTPILAETVETTAVSTSMLVTGPAALRGSLGSGVVFAKAVENAQARSAGAAMRHVLNGGRDTITGSVRADRQAHGYARATSGKTCAFCAMLASRGPVYKGSSVNFHAHDNCHCYPEAIYRRDADWPAGAREYRQQWNDATAGQHGVDALNAFRRSLAG